ncbi:MAG: peptidase U32 family protein [bacterium]
MNKVELLAPAGDLEKLEFALHYGADAVYMGGENFSLRQRAGNFTIDQLRQARDITGSYGAKMYVAVNIFAHNDDIRNIPGYLSSLNQLKVDGLIISDPGIFQYAQEYAPSIPITISTQANTCNWRAARFWQDLGARKICLARELTLRDIKEIRQKTSLELEVFVHGSMCVAYSGRCLLSSYFLHRHGNRGDCAQPCRWKYNLVGENHEEDPLGIEEDSRGTYLLSSRDICMIEHLPELIDAGINSLKIEGRMRSLSYLSVVTRVYREALDTYYSSPHAYQFREAWLRELIKVSQRGYTTGFYFNSNPRHTQYYSAPECSSSSHTAGLVCEGIGRYKAAIKVCSKICREDMIEIFRNTSQVSTGRVVALWNHEHEMVDTLHPGVMGVLEANIPLYRFDLIRKNAGKG